MPEPTAPFDLTGTLALVTGCRRGIGRAMAVALADAGADIIGASANLEAEGRAVATDVEAAGRWGRPADLAGATVFLAAAASDYVHGVVLPVDGGWLGR